MTNTDSHVRAHSSAQFPACWGIREGFQEEVLPPRDTSIDSWVPLAVKAEGAPSERTSCSEVRSEDLGTQPAGGKVGAVRQGTYDPLQGLQMSSVRDSSPRSSFPEGRGAPMVEA